MAASEARSLDMKVRSWDCGRTDAIFPYAEKLDEGSGV